VDGYRWVRRPGTSWYVLFGGSYIAALIDKSSGVQYATKLGYKVIGIDVADAQLEEARNGGALHTFNPMTDKDYIDKIKEITGGGCHAAVNYTASKAAYDATPPLLRAGGIMMVVGIPLQGMS
jgi:propanol-preferring alcohol dehydrogenase